jgi:hypothetical protein
MSDNLLTSGEIKLSGIRQLNNIDAQCNFMGFGGVMFLTSKVLMGGGGGGGGGGGVNRGIQIRPNLKQNPRSEPKY